MDLINQNYKNLASNSESSGSGEVITAPVQDRNERIMQTHPTDVSPDNLPHPRLPGESSELPQPSTSDNRGAQFTRRDNNNEEGTVPNTGRARTNNRRRNNRPRPHERYAESQRILENLFSNEDFTKFFTIKAKNGSSLAEINVIAANKQMNRILGSKPRKVSELRDGSLLVEVANKQQSALIHTIKKLDQTDVEVSKHSKLNQVQGTIRYANKPNYSTAQILEALGEYKTSDIHQIKRKINGVYQHTNLYILTFDACQLPKYVSIGWSQCEVREYIPRPRRCFKCHRFGHGIRTCRQEGNTCVNCGEGTHEGECTNETKCRNCESNDHDAASTSCFYYKLEQETIILQVREKIRYWDARNTAMSRMIKAENSHAAVVGRGPPMQTTQARRETQSPQVEQASQIRQQANLRTSQHQSQINIERRSQLNQTQDILIETRQRVQSEPRQNQQQESSSQLDPSPTVHQPESRNIRSHTQKSPKPERQRKPSNTTRKRPQAQKTAPSTPDGRRHSTNESIPTVISTGVRAKPARAGNNKRYNSENEINTDTKRKPPRPHDENMECSDIPLPPTSTPTRTTTTTQLNDKKTDERREQMRSDSIESNFLQPEDY